MKRLALILALLSSTAFAQAPALIDHAAAPTSAGGSGTTRAVTITGANAFIVCAQYKNLSTPSNPPLPGMDSCNNTYTLVAGQGNAGYGSATALWIAAAPTVCSATATYALTNASAASFMSFSGVSQYGYDQVNSTWYPSSNSSNASGTITPGLNDELIIGCLGTYGATSVATATGPMTLADPNFSYSGAPTPTVASSYEIQGTLAAVNPAFGTVGTNDGHSVIGASFYASENPPPVTVTTTSLSAGVVGTAYSQQLAARYGVPPYTWTLTSGSLIGTGLTLSSSGLLSGTPNSIQTSLALTFTATDSASPTPGTASSSGLTLTTTDTLAVTTASLPALTKSVYGCDQLTSSGGIATYTWTKTAGTLPTGMSLSSAGAICGTPTVAGISAGLAFQVTDGAGATASVSGLSLTITTLTLTAGTCTGSVVTTNMQYTPFGGCTLGVSGGTPPYTFSTAGFNSGYATLPEGLTLNASTGAISGTVYGMGQYIPQFIVTDSAAVQMTLSSITFGVADNPAYANLIEFFPPNSIFHRRVDYLPTDASPLTQLPAGYGSHHLFPGFGAAAYNNVPNGTPWVIVPCTQPFVPVSVIDGNMSFVSAPIPWYAPIETTQNGSSATNPLHDGHVLVAQAPCANSTPRSWEMYNAESVGGGTSWLSRGNSMFLDLTSNAMLTQDLGGADAAGLPLAALMLKYEEVASGAVTHMLRMTCCSKTTTIQGHIWPATNQAGTFTCVNGYSDANRMFDQANPPTECHDPINGGAVAQGPAQGAVYRLTSGAYATALAACPLNVTPQSNVIITAARKYGMILADNGGFDLIGEPNTNWNDTDLACFKTALTASSIEPVYLAGVRKIDSVNSYEATQPVLASIAVSPSTPSITVGATQAFTATCTYVEGIVETCPANVSWSTAVPSVASIGGGGLAVAAGVGTTTVTATLDGIQGTATLTVTGSAPSFIGMRVRGLGVE